MSKIYTKSGLIPKIFHMPYEIRMYFDATSKLSFLIYTLLQLYSEFNDRTLIPIVIPVLFCLPYIFQEENPV